MQTRVLLFIHLFNKIAIYSALAKYKFVCHMCTSREYIQVNDETIYSHATLYYWWSANVSAQEKLTNPPPAETYTASMGVSF